MGDRAVILLVEDNEDDIALTKRALARNEQPYRLVVARDGLEALDLVFEAAPQVDDQATVQPQLILLDIQLPGLSGIDLLQQIRAHERTRFTPVVMLTSSVEVRRRGELYLWREQLYPQARRLRVRDGAGGCRALLAEPNIP